MLTGLPVTAATLTVVTVPTLLPLFPPPFGPLFGLLGQKTLKWRFCGFEQVGQSYFAGSWQSFTG